MCCVNNLRMWDWSNAPSYSCTLPKPQVTFCWVGLFTLTLVTVLHVFYVIIDFHQNKKNNNNDSKSYFTFNSSWLVYCVFIVSLVLSVMWFYGIAYIGWEPQNMHSKTIANSLACFVCIIYPKIVSANFCRFYALFTLQLDQININYNYSADHTKQQLYGWLMMCLVLLPLIPVLFMMSLTHSQTFFLTSRMRNQVKICCLFFIFLNIFF